MKRKQPQACLPSADWRDPGHMFARQLSYYHANDLKPSHDRKRGWSPYDHAPRRRVHGLGPKNFSRSDENIKDELFQRFMYPGDFDLRDVDVNVEGGTVFLTGRVPDRRTKYVLEEIAEDVIGVNGVSNRLKVQRRNLEANSILLREGG